MRAFAAGVVALLFVLLPGVVAAQQADEDEAGVDLPADWPDEVTSSVEEFDHPDSEYWVAQVAAHESQARTDGWVSFENYTVNTGRDVLALPTFAQMAAAPRVEAEVVVRLDTGVNPEALSISGLQHVRQLGDLVSGLHLYTSDATDFVSLLDNVNAHPGVLYAEPGYLADTAAVPNDPAGGGGMASAWWLDQINAFEAWDIATDATAIGPIMIYDQGVNAAHPDLADNLWVSPVDGSHGLQITPTLGTHGTPVSGTACGQGNNGIGYAGSAWDCELMEVRAPLLFSSINTNFPVGMDYAIDNGSRLSNHSWRVFEFSQVVADTVDAAELTGHLLVAAAGNEANDIDSQGVNYPARLPNDNVLTIAASTVSEARISYSSYGAVSVDLAAPTEFVVPNYTGGYSTFSGTSQSAPVVTGAVALAWSRNPALTAPEIKQLTIDSARPVASWSGLTVSGAILDMEALMLAVEPPSGPGSIAGSVTDTDDEPVAGVNIDLFATDGNGDRGQWLDQTTTDGAGAYLLSADAGCYVVTFIAPDGARFTNGDSWLNQDVCVEAGEAVTGIDVQIRSAAVLATVGGSVTAADGSPVASVSVGLFEANGDGSRGAWVGDGQTEADGTYRFVTVAGCYVATFVAPVGESFVGGNGWLNVGACVEAGETVSDLNAQLTGPAGAESISGTVSEAGGGVADVAVDLFTANPDESRGQWLRSTRTDAQGDYLIDVDPGCYVATFIAPSGRTFVGGGAHQNTYTCVSSGVPAVDVDAELAPAGGGDQAVFSGTVTVAGGGSPAGTVVDAFVGNGDGSRGAWLAAAAVGADGGYSFDVAAPGCYVLTFIAPDGLSFGGSGYFQPAMVCAAVDQVVDIDAELS